MLVFLISSVAILGVWVAELAARVAIRRFSRYSVWTPRLRLELEIHPDVHPALSSPARFEINRDGERGSEPPRGTGVYRVLVAGSSNVECNLLDQDQSWPAVLQHRLQQPDRLRALGARRVHVGNIGKSFVDASVLCQVLLRLLPQYPRLDLIVIMVGGVEATRWFVTGETADAAQGQTADWVFDKSPAQEFGRDLKHLALRELAARAWRAWRRPIERQQNVGAWLVRARTMRAHALELREDVPDPSPMLDAFERDLRLGIELATRHADRVLVLRPLWYRRLTLTAEEDARFWHGGTGPVRSQLVSSFYSHESWYRLMSLLDERTVRAATALRVQHVDPLATIDPNFEHMYDHAHLTSAGAARLAEVVEDAICGSTKAADTSDASSVAGAPDEADHGYTVAFRTMVLLFISLATVAIVASYVIFLNPVIDYRVDQTGDAIAYLFLTQSLAETATYPSVHWPPGLPMLFAPVVRVAGADMALIKLGMVAVAFGAVIAVFAWATSIVGRFGGAFVALSVASSPVFFDYSHRFLSEIPFTLFVVLFFVFLQRSSFVQGRAGILEYAVLAAVAAMVQLTRGNGVVLAPALLITAATSRGPLRDGNARTRLWIAFLIVSLAIPAIAWSIRNAQRSFSGIHGSSYLDELKARSPMELWRRGVGPGTERIETASFHDFGVRLYRNIAWGQILNYPRAAAHPIDLGVRASNSTPVALLTVLPVWCLVLIGVGLLYRKCPFAVWYLGLTTIVIVVWPWPWGADVRFVTPVLPVLALAFYLGVNRLVGPHWTAVLTMCIVTVNVWQSVDRGIDQQQTPYASAEFGNVLTLVEAARGELRPNEALVIDPSIAGLGLVKAGRPAVDVSQAIAEMREGRGASALAVVSTLTPDVGLRIDAWAQEQPGAIVQSVRRVGASQLIRVELRRAIGATR